MRPAWSSAASSAYPPAGMPVQLEVGRAEQHGEPGRAQVGDARRDPGAGAEPDVRDGCVADAARATSASTSSIHSSAKIRLGSPTRTAVLSPVMRRSNRMARVPRAASSRAAMHLEAAGPDAVLGGAGLQHDDAAAVVGRASPRAPSRSRTAARGRTGVSRSTIGRAVRARRRRRPRAGCGPRSATRSAGMRASTQSTIVRIACAPAARRARSAASIHSACPSIGATASTRRAAPAAKRSTAGELSSARRTSASVSDGERSELDALEPRRRRRGAERARAA